ncbi:hypothetical protein KSP40_PGU005169 [Platanthera guangdongensis]|uniref:Pseudouridine synthase RsuA/RluA-like domain-containing protein n=1 Tax=Platanthera guangdongensis TaxID=2320717 RepID=A0ABR2MRJ3_9ASPA
MEESATAKDCGRRDATQCDWDQTLRTTANLMKQAGHARGNRRKKCAQMKQQKEHRVADRSIEWHTGAERAHGTGTKEQQIEDRTFEADVDEEGTENAVVEGGDGVDVGGATAGGVVEVFAAGGSALVQWRLETGRTHQIRAHAKYLGVPLLGDELYGGTKGMALSLLKPRAPARSHALISEMVSRLVRPCLHAQSLGVSRGKLCATSKSKQGQTTNDLAGGSEKQANIDLACNREEQANDDLAEEGESGFAGGKWRSAKNRGMGREYIEFKIKLSGVVDGGQQC